MDKKFGLFSDRKFKGHNFLDKLTAIGRRLNDQIRAEPGAVNPDALMGDLRNRVVSQTSAGVTRLLIDPNTGESLSDASYWNVINWFKSIGIPEDGYITILAFVYNPVDGCVYVGGNFASLGGVAVSNIAKYDPSTKTISALSTGLNGQVSALAVDSTGLLYVGGQFTDAGGDANADKFCKWNGSAFSSCGTAFAGVATYVNALAVDPTTDDVYIGGTFLNIGDANGDYVVKWNGSAYSSLGASPLNGQVRFMCIDSTGLLYLSGDFTNAGGDADADRVCKWNGSAFSAVGTVWAGAANYPLAFLVDASDDVYMAGQFTNIGDANGDYIVKWDGSAYVSLSTGLTEEAYSLAKDSLGNIYVHGTVYLYKWDGSAFTVLGDGLDQPAFLAVDGNDMIYCGGGFREDLNGRVLWGLASYGPAPLGELLSYLLARAGRSQVLNASLNLTLAASTSFFTAPGRNTIADTTTRAGLLIQRAGVIKNLRIGIFSTQPATGNLVITVYKVNAATNLALIIPAGTGAGFYSDLLNVFSVAANDRITFLVDNQATGTSAVIGSISVELY